MNDQGKRFEMIYKEGGGFTAIRRIIRDNETGVQYLQTECGYGVAVTPLLDRDGKPLTDPKYEYR